MAKLKEYNGHYCESEYEYAFIGFLEAEGWKYTLGNNITRNSYKDVLISEDFLKFIKKTNSDLTDEEVSNIFDNVRLVGGESDFAALHKVYGWMVDGVQFIPSSGIPRMVDLIDYDNPENNIFRVVNQYVVEYTNNGKTVNRRPDVLLFVNGMPLCVIELKNPADAHATVYDAWEQINIRYWRDIPHLLHFCPLACISDGVKTRLGTVRTPYEHFYAWRRVNDGDEVSTLPFAETETMIKGVYAPERFLEIFRDYIYFQDSIYDSDEVEIVCRYPQFFAAKLLKKSIVNSVVTKSGKGGTYFGATGCGKTVVFSKVAEDRVSRGGRVLVMAHRGELLDQAADKIRQVTGIDCAYEKASVSALGSLLPITVGSVQSLCQERRLSQFPFDYYSSIIVDEAHHCLSDSYQRVLEHFPEADVLGVTATADRADKRNLGTYFDSQAYEYTMTQAIREGYLCPIKAQMIPLKLDISDVGVSNGDYNVGEIGHALEPYLRQIAQEIAEHYSDRKTVVFLPLIHTSQTFCSLLQEMGVSAAEVNGNSADRAEILRDFEAGRYSVLCNSMLLTEGWDCPSVDCVVMLRPTKVRSLYQQAIGRGTRLFPGKTELLILDFLWLTERHDLCRPSSLISKDENIAARIDQQVMNAEYGVDIMEAEETAERDTLAERERSLAEQLAIMRNRTRKLVDPLQYAMSIAAEDLATYTPTFVWEMGPPTQKQLQFLEKRGIFADSIENTGKASMLIDRLIKRQDEGLSTPKQIRCLERYGFRQVGTWTFDQASSLISRLAANNWRIPFGMNASAYVP